MQKIGTAGPEIVIEVVTSREVDAVEQHVHVRGGVDRDPAVPNLAERARIVGVAAHERGHVECDRQPAAARGRGSSCSARWSARRSRIRRTAGSSTACPVARRVNSSRERVLPRPADTLEPVLGTRRPVKRLDLYPGQGRVVPIALRRPRRSAAASGRGPPRCHRIHGARLLGRPTIWPSKRATSHRMAASVRRPRPSARPLGRRSG